MVKHDWLYMLNLVLLGLGALHLCAGQSFSPLTASGLNQIHDMISKAEGPHGSLGFKLVAEQLIHLTSFQQMLEPALLLDLPCRA